MQIFYVSFLISTCFQIVKPEPNVDCVCKNLTPTPSPSPSPSPPPPPTPCCRYIDENPTSTSSPPQSLAKFYVQKSLIFVYDVINPGVDYYEFVQGIGKIYNDLFQPGPEQLFHQLLVVFPSQTSVDIHTFNDTNSESIVETLLDIKSDIEQEKTLADVSRVLTGLWKGLFHGESNSLIYVFTNAKPQDKSIMTGIVCAIENKMIEVGFVIEQKYPELGIPEEYQTISIRGSGLILNVHRDSQIMNFFSILLTSTKHKVNLMTINNVQNRQHGVIFDKYLDEITIADFTFEGVSQYITNHYHYSKSEAMITSTSNVQRTRHLCALKTKIESFKNISRSDLLINVDTNSLLYGLRVFGVSGFNFEYEFSININKENCNCPNGTKKRPVMDVLNYIHVRATNEEYGAVFKSCKIIATDNSFSKEITLQKSTSSEHDVYYGSFVPNFQAFFVQVTADINGEVVQRMSSFAITAFIPAQKNEINRVEISSSYRNKNYYSKETGQIIRFK